VLALPVRKARRYRQAENRLRVVRAQGTGRIDRKENQDVGRIVVKEKKGRRDSTSFSVKNLPRRTFRFPPNNMRKSSGEPWIVTKLHVENFKGIQICNVEDISTVNLFIGKNHSGKSAILDARY
jgi:hypothetical protein